MPTTTLDAAVYDLTQSLWGPLVLAARAAGDAAPVPPPVLLQLRAGLAESPGWFLVQAEEFDPVPLSVENLRMRDIYASERIVQALLELMASEQWLRREGGAYYLTDAGRTLRQKAVQRLLDGFARVESLPVADLERLARHFDRLITASLQSAQPPGVWSLAHSRRRAPAGDAPLLAHIFQYVADFNAFRDDAHMAAWQPLQLDGRTWECFALVASGAAASADEIFRQIPHRGYASEDYAAALADLAQRGWLEEHDMHRYRLTAQGRRVVGEVEQRTNSYFYEPWSCLSEQEIADLPTLIVQLRDALQAVAQAGSSI